MLHRERSEEITGDVWDFLHSLGDFQEFKAMMIAQKNVSLSKLITHNYRY